MTRWTLVLVLALSACKGPSDEDTDEADADTDADTDTDTDADTDTDTDAEETDCSDGTDDDGDGLVDCEDADCVDACMEDCSDGTDNDGDGFVDCDDDECSGSEDCQGGDRYEVQSTIVGAWAAVYYGDGVHSYIGYRALAYVNGYVELTATPADTALSSFTCSGALIAGPPASDWLNPAYDGLVYEPDSDTDPTAHCAGCDYAFAFEPTVANGAIVWDSACPVEGLPPTRIGFWLGTTYITQLEGGVWRQQYVDPNAYSGQYYYGSGHGYWQYLWFDAVTQANPRQFTWYAP